MLSFLTFTLLVFCVFSCEFFCFFSLVPLLHHLFRLASSHSLTRCNCVGGCLAWLVDWLHVILMLNGYRLAQWPIIATGSCRSRTLLILYFCKSLFSALTQSCLLTFVWFPLLLLLFIFVSLFYFQSMSREFNHGLCATDVLTAALGDVPLCCASRRQNKYFAPE